MHITTTTTKAYTLTMSAEEITWLRNHIRSKPFDSEISETKTTRELLCRLLNEAINPSRAYPDNVNIIPGKVTLI